MINNELGALVAPLEVAAGMGDEGFSGWVGADTGDARAPVVVWALVGVGHVSTLTGLGTRHQSAREGLSVRTAARRLGARTKPSRVGCSLAKELETSLAHA
jgi:hypothetical protein